MNFGKTIRELRISKGMTQKELADRANISRSYVTRIENKGKQGTPEILRRILNVFDLDLKIEIVPKDKQPLD